MPMLSVGCCLLPGVGRGYMKPLSDVGVERIADVVVDKKGNNVDMSRKLPDLVSWELMTILAVNNGALGVGVSPVALEVELFVHPVDAV